MKAIITGTNGTVAPVVANYFEENNIEVIKWNRSKISTEDEAIVRDFIESVNPDMILHIGMGSPDFAELLAKICNEKSIKFLFTSTVSVFSEFSSGPYDITSTPDAEDDYGKYKILCEEKINSVNKNAYIVRLGWQIGTQAGSNNMIDFLEKNHTEHGTITASNLWYPSSSFITDTAKGLYNIITTKPSGLYLLNGNKDKTFYDIVNSLNKIHGNRWTVLKGEIPNRDDRMFDDRVIVDFI